jgi:Sigma-70, region 4
MEDSLIDPAPNPEDQLATDQTKRRLMAILQALPEQNRSCLYLRAEGLRYREIAEVLNMSLGSVSLCLERSLARIARRPNGEFVLSEQSHLSDQELLLVVDGELSERDAGRAVAHLSTCWACMARKQDIEAAIGEFIRCGSKVIMSPLSKVEMSP